MLRKRLTSAIVAVAALALALTACAGAPAVQTVNREAAAITDCGSIWGSTTTYSVQVRNLSSAWIQLKDTEIDCYDWAYTANPTRLNVELSPGSASAVETFALRSIPEYGNVIRPWNWNVVIDPFNGAGPLATGGPALRPVIKFASQQCNTGAGMTACIGSSLCADDPAGMRVETDVNLAYRRSGKKVPLKMTTLCSASDRSAFIIFTDK